MPLNIENDTRLETLFLFDYFQIIIGGRLDFLLPGYYRKCMHIGVETMLRYDEVDIFSSYTVFGKVEQFVEEGNQQAFIVFRSHRNMDEFQFSSPFTDAKNMI